MRSEEHPGLPAQASARPSTAVRRARIRVAAGIAALAAAGAFAAATDLALSGRWHGLYLLRGREGPRLELANDLSLGDGPSLVASLSFSPLRRLAMGGAVPSGSPWLSLDWDEADGSGIVTSHLGDGRELLTQFSRYRDSDGKEPHGLFVGGALPDVAADATAQNESGMALRDGTGWRHVWCNVNEGILDPAAGMSYPSEWRFLGSHVLILDPERIVIGSSHELTVGGERVLMERVAYFRAGRPWFKLSIRIVNAGDDPIRITYAYGDEPWVGNFGAGEANVGWVEEGVVREEGWIDPQAHRWAGILDEATLFANFVSWIGGDLPNRVLFSNSAGSAGMSPGRPLASNSVFIGLEWRDRVLQPGADMSILLSLGAADMDGEGRPHLPDRAGPR